MTTELFPIIPEIFLACMAMVLLIFGAFKGDAHAPFVAKSSALVLLLTAVLVGQLWTADYEVLNDLFIVDSFAVFVKVVILLGGACMCITSLGYLKHKSKGRFEHPVLILLSIVGMMVMVSANDLLVLYMGLELQSLSLYILASINRDASHSSEAGLKYFVLGALASGILLFGCSFVYGFAGTTHFDSLASLTSGRVDDISTGLLLGIIMVIIGLCFKIAAAPFHMWTPDVYEGSPTAVTAFFAIAPKVAAVALVVRVLMDPFGGFSAQWTQVIVLLSVVSMLVGSLGALKQTNIKRLLAYSSIGHVGYMLIAVAAGTSDGVQAILVYLAIYAVMSIGVFACVLRLSRRGEVLEKVSDFAGLATHYPGYAMIMTILMFSMAGIPPLAGFFGKLFVFKAAIGAGMFALAVFGVITSVVAAFYYLRIIKLIYFDQADEDIDQDAPLELRAIMVVAAIVNVGFFIFPTPLLDLAETAATSLFL